MSSFIKVSQRVVSRVLRAVLARVESGSLVTLNSQDTKSVLQLMEQAQKEQVASQLKSMRDDIRLGMNMLAGRLNENTERLVELTTTVEVMQNDMAANSEEDGNSETDEEVVMPPMTDKWPAVSVTDTTANKKRVGKNVLN